MRLFLTILLMVLSSSFGYADQPVSNTQNAVISFFGLSVSIPYEQQLGYRLNDNVSSYKILDWVETISKSNVDITVQSINQTVDEYHLNDWGKLLLVEQFTRSVHSDVKDQKLLSWFLMRKLGYDFRLGYMSSGVIWIMAALDVSIYDNSFYVFDGKKYYIMDPIGKSITGDKIHSYRGIAPEAHNVVKLKNMKSPLLPLDKIERTLVINNASSSSKVNFILNKNIIDYYNTIPQCELVVYTSAEPSKTFNENIHSFIGDMIGDKNSLEAVGTLLSIVQDALPYMEDARQFSKEKIMFPEETLYYPYSDCEDRSILFAFLTTKLIGRKIILLDYPDHISTAVENDTPYGKTFRYKEKLYIAADPTCINCRLGTATPNLADVTPSVVETGY